MKKIVTIVGATAMFAVLAIPALAANGISTISDESMAHITTKNVKSFINSTISSIGISNGFQGTNTVVSSATSGGNYLSAVSDVKDSVVESGEVGNAVEVDSSANTTEVDTTTSSDQTSSPMAEEDNVIESVEDSSMATIDTDKTASEQSSSVTVDGIEQMAMQDNMAALNTDSGNNGASGNDIENVGVKSGTSVSALKFTSVFNMANLKKVFTYKQ